jgi:molybdate transport repressor ModE-like protein
MSDVSSTKPTFKIWLETDEGFVFGPGVYGLLKKALETGTLKGSAKALGMSYRFAWGLLKKAEERLGQPLVESHKGGRSGGGGVELTEVGLGFLDEFSKIEILLDRLLEDPELLEKEWIESRITVKVQGITCGEGETEIDVKTSGPIKMVLKLPPGTPLLVDLQEGDMLTLDLLSTARSIEKERR